MFRRILFSVITLLALASSAFGQGVSKYDQVIGVSFGQLFAVPNATIRVCAANSTGNPCTPLANIYSDPALTQQIANPTIADANGNYFFYIAPGIYDIQISGTGISTITQTSVSFSCATACAGLGGNNTFTGNNAFTGSNTHSGTEAFNGPLVMTGTDSGTQTISGAKTFTGPDIHNGTETFTAKIVMANLNSIFFVDGITFTTLASAVAACPVAGCWIIDNFPETFSSNPFAGITAPMRIDFGAGVWMLNAQIVVPSNVGLFTGSGREGAGSTLFKAGGSMPTNTPLIKALGTQGQVLSRFVVDCNSTVGSTGIFATDWNENSGIEKLLVINCPIFGVNVDATQFTSIPAQNYFIRDLEVFPQLVASIVTVGLHLKGNGGGGPADVSNVTINGRIGSGNSILASIQAENFTQASFSRIHGEYAVNVFQNTANSISNFLIDTITYTATDTNVVNINASSTANTFMIRNLAGPGGVNSIVDGPRSVTLTDPSIAWYGVGGGSIGSQDILTSSPNLQNVFVDGLKTSLVLSTSVNPAGSGMVRLNKTDTIAWRNNANSGDIWITNNGAALGTIPADVLSVNASGLIAGAYIDGTGGGGGTPAATGVLRLNSTDPICWRNNANSGDLCLNKNSSDTLQFGTSTLPILTQCGTIAAAGACSNVTTAQEHCIAGIATLSGGTSTITGISPVFTSSSSWYIVTNDITTITNASKGVPASGSTATFTGTGTDNIQFIGCGG